MRFRPSVVVGCVLFLSAGAWALTPLDVFLDDLNKGTPEKRLAAATALKDFVKYPEVVTALAARLDDAKDDVVLRSACATALGYSNDKSVYPMLQTLAKKPDEKMLVRAACLGSMAMMKKGDAIPELVEMLRTEKNNGVRQQIVDSLVQMNEPQKVTVAVTPLLKEDAAWGPAISILAAVGGPAVISLLAKELEEGKQSKRQTVIRSLGIIHDPKAAEALVGFYPKANDAEKVDILAALAAHPHPKAIQLMIGELESEKISEPIRSRSALSLGMLHPPEGIKSLVKVLLNTVEQEGLRKTCAQALGEYSDRDDAAIVGLIGGLADKKLAEDCSLSLSRVTHRYMGLDKDKWTEWFQTWRDQRDQTGHVGH